MGRLAKFAAAAAAALLVGAVAALLALRHMFPPEKLRTIALERLRNSLGREVRIGSIRIGFSGVDIGGLEISEAPDFTAGTFLKAEGLNVRPRLLPLLRRRVEIADVAVKDWTCRIVKRPDGSFNFSSLAGSPAGGSKAGGAPVSGASAFPSKGAPARHRAHARPSSRAASPRAAAESEKEPPKSDRKRPGVETHAIETGKTASAPVWAVDRLRSQRGTLRYEDAPANLSLTLDGVEASARALHPDGEFPVKLALGYSGKLGKTALKGRLDYRGAVDLGGSAPEKFMVELRPLRLEYEGLRLEASGVVRNSAAPEIELKLSIPKQAAEQWKAIPLPSGVVPPSVDADLKASRSGQSVLVEKLDLHAGASTGPAGIRVPPVSFKLSGEMKGGGTRISVRSCAVEMGGLRLQARGDYLSPAGKPATVAAEVETNQFSIAEVAVPFSQAQGLSLQGSLSLKLRAEGPASSPALTGSAELKDLGARAAGQTLSGLGGTVRFSPTEVTAQAKGRLNDGDLKLDVVAADYRTAPNVKLTGTLSVLDLTKLPQKTSTVPTAPRTEKTASSAKGPESAGREGEAKTVRSSGKFTIGRIAHPNFNAARSELGWDLNQLQAVDRLTGTARFRIGEGKFDRLEGMADKKSLLRTALLPLIILQKATGLAKIPVLPSFDRVDFKEITGQYTFENGLMTIKESHLDSSAAYVAATGTADLAKDQVDVHISTKLGTQLGLKLSGPVGFTVKGSLSSPSVRPDVAAILRQPVVNNAIEQGKNLLKNIFK